VRPFQRIFTGDEQESVYVRLSHRWKPIERFLGIGSPVDTSAQQPGKVSEWPVDVAFKID
jgi:hypothetical protein